MEEIEGKRDRKVTEGMVCYLVLDVLEPSCSVRMLFTLSQLFKYRGGEYKVDNQLSCYYGDEGVQNLIKQMISLDPSERPTFDTFTTHTSRGTVFPESFYSFLHNYVCSVNELSSDVLAVNSPPLTVLPTHIALMS